MIFVIFDIDGTLTNTKRVEDKCFKKAFKETFNINIDRQKWEDINYVTDWGITEEIIQREMNRLPSPLEYLRMISNFMTNLSMERAYDETQFLEVAGAKSFFDHLNLIDEIQVGIATGSWEQSALFKLDLINLDVSGVSFSNSSFHKSREAITLDVVSQLRIKSGNPERIIYFGDGEWDFQSCKNLEIEFVGIDVENDGKLRKIGAPFVFADYLNIKEILDKIF